MECVAMETTSALMHKGPKYNALMPVMRLLLTAAGAAMPSGDMA